MEAGEIFNKLYNTDIYTTNRLLTDFDQDAIDELQRSGNYPNLFTESLQTDLYKARLQNLVSEVQFNELLKLHRQNGISWSKIYRITEIMESDTENFYVMFERLLIQIAQKDDVEAIEILRVLRDDLIFLLNAHYSRLDQNLRVSRLINHFIANQSRRAILYLLKNKMVTEQRILENMTENVGEWDDLPYLREYVPLAVKRTSEILNDDRIDARHLVLQDIYTVSVNDAAVKYLVEAGFHFDGEAMALIYADERTRHLVPYLLEHGADPIDRDFYRQEYGKDLP